VNRSLVLHGHFYQPPREDPVLDEIGQEASAAPDHDWNQRIERECYRAVVAARVPGPGGRIRRIVNTLESISFNVGPTLFEWMERHAEATCRQIIAADRASCKRLNGHGNAIAHPYHHVILPLASRRDKRTEVRWGIADFRKRFGREPEGMWLPETAVDDETLDVLAEEGVRFTILAPHQVESAPPAGLPGQYLTSQGRTIAIFVYDGPLSHGIAFGGLVRDAALWWKAMRWPSDDNTLAAATRPPRDPAERALVSAATDGETFGHHHKFAEMALAAVLDRAREDGVSVENFASFLAANPATHEVALLAPSSWSCAHGVERWRSDCGCRLDGAVSPSQAWRKPLREGLSALALRLHEVFTSEGERCFSDPWAARDAYGELLPFGNPERRDAFLMRWLASEASDVTRALELLEMERDAMRMFTSCAWFFDDVGGIETQQVLKYAIRAADLAGDSSGLRQFEATMGQARSNVALKGTGADVLRALAPPGTTRARVAAAAHTLDAFGIDVVTHMPREFAAHVAQDRVGLVNRKTGRISEYIVSGASRGANDLCQDVHAVPVDGSAKVRVCLADYPEESRHQVRRALRDALLPQCLTSSERALLASGEVSLRELVAVALTRAIDEVSGNDGTETAMALLDLFEQLETSIPFDAQSAWWRLRMRTAGAPTEAIAALGRRLGFNPDAVG
jgi:alpha-amylase/alpha-mannosidase (GH57 family)